MAEASWRIDELAQKAGLTVDTIRYYAREGLLPPPTKQGRNRLYGAEHLERLDRIRELQTQRFSLAAIRAIVDVDRPGLEGLFSAGERELLPRRADRAVGDRRRSRRRPARGGAAARPRRVRGRELRRHRPRRAPRRGRAALDRHDREILLALGRIYVDHFAELQRDVLDMLSGKDNPAWSAEEVVAVQQQLTANAQRFMPAINQLLNYVHQRTLQRLTLEAARGAEEPHEG